MALTNKLEAIANAIRAKTGKSGKMSLSQMVSEINSIKQGITPTGKKIITSNGENINVASFEYVDVDVPTGVFVTEEKTVTPTESVQVVTADSADALSTVTVEAIPTDYIGSNIPRKNGLDVTANAQTVVVPEGYYATEVHKSVASGTAGTPSISMGAVSDHSVTLTPQVTNTAGYITGGSKSGTPVTVFASDLVSDSIDITANGTNIDVTNLRSVNVNVPTGGTTAKNVQTHIGYNTVSTTAYTGTSQGLTVAKTGTYNVSWTGWRNTNSGTNGSQLYINGTAYGSAQTTYQNTYGQYVNLQNVSLKAGDQLQLYARARSTSYIVGVANLTIEEV